MHAHSALFYSRRRAQPATMSTPSLEQPLDEGLRWACSGGTAS